MKVLNTIDGKANPSRARFWLFLAFFTSLTMIFITALKPIAFPRDGAEDRSAPTSLGGPLCQNNKIRIDPAFPTPEDVVHFTFSGNWCDACVPEYASQQIIEDVIQVYAEANPEGYSCPLVITPWEIKTDAGPFPAGKYTVEFYISLMGLPPVLNDSREFIILPGAPEIHYLPLIQSGWNP